MPPRNDWVPSEESALIDLMKVWQLKLLNQSLQTAYGWVALECTTTVASLTAFVSAYDAYHNTPTHPNRMAKDIAKETAKSAMRKFASERIRFNPKMTPPQRDELGVITRDPTPTPIPVPDKGPECTARTDIDVQGIVEFLYLKAKPKGVELIEMAWGYADGQDVSAESLPYRETFSHNPLRLHFREEDRSTSGLRLLIAFSISKFAALRKTKPL